MSDIYLKVFLVHLTKALIRPETSSIELEGGH
jgi:hypothetical protein